jgi:hypothetical protein
VHPLDLLLEGQRVLSMVPEPILVSRQSWEEMGQKEKFRSRIEEKEDEGDRPQISGGGALLLN